MKLSKEEISVLFEVNAFLLNNRGRRYHINLLAAMFNIDAGQLKEGYRLVFGETLIQAQIRMSMEAALIDLQNGALVKVVIRKYGYKSKWSFAKVFKKVNGFNPHHFKKA